MSKNTIWMESLINESISNADEEKTIDTNMISDGYHTFWELYLHRIHLFLALCRTLVFNDNNHDWNCIKSKLHNDWEWFDWMFIVQLETSEWQISYHLPNEYWDICEFMPTLSKANKWDGHSSEDVLNRLLKI